MSKAKKTTNRSKIENKVMAKITSGQVKMRPHYYYSLVTVLSFAAVAVLAFALSYLLSLTNLWLRIQTATGQAWGAQRNLTSLVDNFPWWAILLAIAELVGLILIVKKLGKLYKVKLVYLVTAIVAIALLIGYGLSFTNLPNTFKKQPLQANCDTTATQCTTQVKGYRFGQQ